MTKKPVLSHSTEQILKPRENDHPSISTKNVSEKMLQKTFSPDSNSGFLVRNLLDQASSSSPPKSSSLATAFTPTQNGLNFSAKVASKTEPNIFNPLALSQTTAILNQNGVFNPSLWNTIPSVGSNPTPTQNIFGTYPNPLTFAYTRQFYQNLLTQQALQAISRTPLARSHDHKSIKVITFFVFYEIFVKIMYF